MYTHTETHTHMRAHTMHPHIPHNTIILLRVRDTTLPPVHIPHAPAQDWGSSSWLAAADDSAPASWRSSPPLSAASGTALGSEWPQRFLSDHTQSMTFIKHWHRHMMVHIFVQGFFPGCDYSLYIFSPHIFSMLLFTEVLSELRTASL